MKKMLATLAALLMVAVMSPVDATHPDSEGICPEYVQYLPSDSETTSYPVYFTIDEVNSNGYLYSIWIYAESNGVDGIQRDDGYCYTDGYTTETADTIIF